MRSFRPLVRRPFTSGAGILGIDYHYPRKVVSHNALEEFDGVGQGKYTIGLGQESFAFVDDLEDSVSLMMNAFSNLMTSYDISPDQIGALYVGTESAVDRSKSVKSYLMQILDSELGSNTNVEGVDNVNACYGGTQSLWDACYWIESHQSFDDRYAVVVCGDNAGYKEPNARPTSGAGAVAMLIGPNAPIQLDISKKHFHFDHVFDFYKPDPSNLYPVVDGPFSNACYLEALDRCFTGGEFSLSETDHVLFHSPYNKLVQKAVAFLMFAEAENLLGNDLSTRDWSYSDCELLNELRKDELYDSVYNSKTSAGTFLPQRIGNSYTSSLYFSLISLLGTQDLSKLSNSTALLFSYGSGLASAMFELSILDNDSSSSSPFSLERIRNVLDVEDRFYDGFVEMTPEYFTRVEERNEMIYSSGGIKGLVPKGEIELLRDGQWYLEGIDELFRREYVENN